jgi:hypothetical protein
LQDLEESAFDHCAFLRAAFPHLLLDGGEGFAALAKSVLGQGLPGIGGGFASANVGEEEQRQGGQRGGSG